MNDKIKMQAEKYLGDGVYAGYDGYHLWLELKAQPGSPPKIGLDPIVFRRVKDFAETSGQTKDWEDGKRC